MRYQESANEVIRLILLNQKTSSELIDWAEEHRQRGDWEGIRKYWKSQFENALRPLDGSDYVEGVGQAYLGAAYYRLGEWEKALDHFQRAEQMFSFENDWYSVGLVHMAQGLVYRAQGDSEKARIVYQQSQQIFSGLVNKCKTLLVMRKANQCAGLCGRLRDMIEQLTTSDSGQGPLHFIPQIGVTTAAGEPLYMPGEDSQNATGKIVLGGTRYQLLSLRERKPRNDFVLSPRDKYFATTVHGDSMIGAKIYHGDLLLVKKQDSWPELREIAVFQEEDSGPMVKIFYKTEDRIYLESANPKYRGRIYDKDSPTLGTIGIVIAILQEAGD